MKTAMQELIEYVQELYSKDDILEVIVNKANRLLAKEKKQIINAYADGAKGGANGTKGQHDFGWVPIQVKEKYYNQNYNQKIPPCSGHAFETE